MSLNDPISDALTCIRNASRAKKERVDLRSSRMIKEIVRILREEHFVHDFRVIDDKKQGVLRVYLTKAAERTRPISKIMRVSRPGIRHYAQSQKIPVVLNGLGVCILSTSQGIMTGEEAKKRGVGGEILCKIW